MAGSRFKTLSGKIFLLQVGQTFRNNKGRSKLLAESLRVEGGLFRSWVTPTIQVSGIT